MSSFLQAILVNGVTNGLTLSTFVLEHLGVSNLLNINTSQATFIPLTEHPTAFFIRSFWKDSARVIRVFDSTGTQVFSFERLSSFNPVWSLLTFPDRKEVATINTSVFSKSVDIHNMSGVTHRPVTSNFSLGGASQNFYLNDGAVYSWSRGTKFLEKIINPDGSSEEVRERIAKVKLMRQFKFDFEMLVDESQIKAEVALSTGFISMFTQWGVGEKTSTVGPTYIPPVEEEPSPQPVEETSNKMVIVIENQIEGISVET